jgi:ATP-binding cassette, subfamily B, bacterial
MPRGMRRLRSSGKRNVGVAGRLLRNVAVESPKLFVLGTATAVVQSALLIPIALLVRHVFDVDIPRRHVGSIVISGSAILVLYAANAASALISRAVALRITARAATRIRSELLTKLYALPQTWHDRHRAGALHAVLVLDTERVEAMLGTFASLVLPAAVVGSALVILAAVLSLVLFAVLLAVAGPLALAARVLARRLRTRVDQAAVSRRRFSAESQLRLRGMITAKVLGGDAAERRRGEHQAQELAEHNRRLGIAGAAFNAVQLGIGAAAGSGVLIVGGIAVSHHEMTLGSLVSFYAILALLIRQLSTVGLQTGTVLTGLDSLARVEAILTDGAEEPYKEGRRPLHFRGGITVSDVSFAYREALVLREISFAIGPGEHLALIGPNGAGKSTLVNLLLGLYRPQAGELRADETPYENLDIADFRRQIGVVLQDPVLLPGTIRENIAYARPDATDAEVRAAAQGATAAHFIETLPADYSTAVGDEGTGLSGGQRQRIAIARALLGSPALLVLDEPTTYLDEASVSGLMSRLMELPQRPTVLLVTHDPQVAAHVDRVIELRDGHVISDRRTGRVAAVTIS